MQYMVLTDKFIGGRKFYC